MRNTYTGTFTGHEGHKEKGIFIFLISQAITIFQDD